jgi:hypothetical protein
MENSIKEDIKIVENYLANSAINEIDSNFFKNSGWETVDLEIPKSMQHILLDYKRVLKENEELNEKILDNAGIYQLGFKDGEESYIKKVKDNIEELEEELEIMKVDNMYGRYKEYGGKTKWKRLFATKYGMHDALQELLEGRKENEI